LQKLRIAILSYRSAEFGGGQGVYVRDISFALSLMGHDVDVISGKDLNYQSWLTYTK